MKYEENGAHSISFKNALAHAKRNAKIEKYEFTETVLDAKYGYSLTDEETAILKDRLTAYCQKNHLYSF